MAWFTDAAIPGATRLTAPSERPGPAPGTVKQGIRPKQPVPVEWPALNQDQGYLSFWLRPRWDGNDGQPHRLLRLGDPARNGFAVEKTGRGFLRFVMASPSRTSVARCDVSHWQAGDWHHVTAVWRYFEGRPHGITLFLDELPAGHGGPEAVDGPLAAGNRFVDPGSLADRRLWLGGEDAEADMDELVLRTGLRLARDGHQLMRQVYQDFYATAPFTALRVDPEPNYARADHRVVAGHAKQFGLRAALRGRELQLTDFTARYGNWGDFDAKPLIRWETTDAKVATVNSNGLVTGIAPGRCKLIARFRELKASSDLAVIPLEQPDLSVLWLTRLPRYHRDALKNMPSPGETVTTVATIGNFGYRASPPGVEVRFDLVPDRNGNYRLDPDERPAATQRQTLENALRPAETTEVSFSWTWPSDPMWVRVTIDPQHRLAELCKANNQRQHLTTARPVRVGYETKEGGAACHANHRINLTGSFCYHDYAQAQFECLDHLLRGAVSATTSPDGVRDSFYIDGIYPFEKWDDGSAFFRDAGFFDGHHVHVENILMAQNSGALHEGGHNLFALPDLYNYGLGGRTILLRDPAGRPYAGTEPLPAEGHDPLAPARTGPYYSSFMNGCHLWLHPANAGKMQYYRGFRGERFWGSQGRLLATWRHSLLFFDWNDAPLTNAAIQIYHGTRKVFADRPKFQGHTDAEGRFLFPQQTDSAWDDDMTDDVEGSVKVWNPFGRGPSKGGLFDDVPFTPNVIETQGILLVKVVSDDQTEFHWVTDLDFESDFLAGHRLESRIPIRTCLRSSRQKSKLVRVEIPAAVARTNRAPHALVARQEITVPCNGEFTIDASASNDPEGQPLQFIWSDARVTPDPANPAMGRGKAPWFKADWQITVLVTDGVRHDEVVVKMHAVPDK